MISFRGHVCPIAGLIVSPIHRSALNAGVRMETNGFIGNSLPAKPQCTIGLAPKCGWIRAFVLALVTREQNFLSKSVELTGSVFQKMV
jgi:hypothetical protein